MIRVSPLARSAAFVALLSALVSALTACDVKGLIPTTTPTTPGGGTSPTTAPSTSPPPAPGQAASAPSVWTPERLALLRDLGTWDAATSAQRTEVAQLVPKRCSEFAFTRLETFSCGGRSHELAVFRHERAGLDFVLVPGGTFTMGSSDGETGRLSGETAHRVTLTHALLASRTEVTQRAYSLVLGDDPSKFKSPDNPVETVTFTEASKFARRAGCELPTEAQWEYLARGGASSAYCFGDNRDALGEYAWFDANAGGTTHGVGLKKPNAFGLFDVHGNVFEWTRDAEYEYTGSSVTDPSHDSREVHKLTRGGAYLSNANSTRAAFRIPNHGSDKNYTLGFRVVRVLAFDG